MREKVCVGVGGLGGGDAEEKAVHVEGAGGRGPGAVGEGTAVSVAFPESATLIISSLHILIFFPHRHFSSCA